MNNNILTISNVSKAYKIGSQELKVLDNISLNVESGEFVSIMGPSGSGKSTLLYTLGTLEQPTEGKIFLDGQDITKCNDKIISKIRCQKIGFIYQFYNLMPDLSVEENILLPVMLDGKKITQYKEKLKMLLNDVGLYDRRKHKPQELSGGQQQRTAIARALVVNPKLILADEPIGNLDSQTGTEVMELLRSMNRKYGTTIIQVTHSEESAKYGSRIIYLKDGKIVNG